MRQAVGWMAPFVLFISYYLLTELWPEHGLVVWVLLVVVTVGILLAGAAGTIYECPACGHRFDIEPGTDVISPHYPGAKRLRCPKCGKVEWARSVKRGATTRPNADSGADRK